jgi:short-subunit dehydrogenase
MALSFMRIDGKVVLITGASQGIGAACAARFRDRGAKIALTARSLGRLYDVSRDGELVAAGDITDADFRTELVERTLERFGRIDILLNNAGAGLYAPAWNAEESQVRRLFELNFFAPLALIGLVAPRMCRQRSGTIVNIGSIAGKVTLPWFTLYSASKFALGSLTDGLRMELKRDGIHAMTVCPGYVLTDFQKNVLAGRPPEAISRHRHAAISAGECARAIVRGVERDARTVVTPWTGWLLVAAERLFPGLVDSRLELIHHEGDPVE